MKSSKVIGFLVGELVSAVDVDRLGLGSMTPAAGVDIATLTAKTPEPFFVYVRAGRVGNSSSTVNGKPRNWLPKTLERILTALPLYGYRGHPDPEQFRKQRTWRDFVTVWDYASSNDKSSKDLQKFLVQSGKFVGCSQFDHPFDFAGIDERFDQDLTRRNFPEP